MTPRREEITDWLTGRLAPLLGLPPDAVPLDLPFTRMGLSSMQAVELSDDLQRWTGRELPPTVVYDYPTIAEVAAFATGRTPEADQPTDMPSGSEPIAVVGIGCRVPGADGPEHLWQLLCDEVDAITTVPASRWDAHAFYDPDPSVPGRMNTRWGGFLADVAGFDADFFGISAREAARSDPQQRLALEVAWEALEDAGIPPGGLSGSLTGVFMGVSSFDHATALFSNRSDVEPYDGTGGALSIVANRLSYCLNLRGPSMVLDTACSSSLVAVHFACQALRTGEAELALAGGVNVITSPRLALSFSKGGLMAPDGRCKPFDHRANGYVRSEGVGVIVLKPLSRALADSDRVYAVVLGGAVNQDGRTNGLTAPNRPAQEAVLRAAYRAAGVDPAEVAYVEAHGTGTAIGDPVEVGALATVLGAGRPAARPLRIGSVKSNLGHLEAAAGVTGLIKAALALRHRRLPGTVHFEKANPLLGLDRVPVVVTERTGPWPKYADGPALAGVSSFGFGGTNCHVVLRAAPDAPPREAGPTGMPRLIPVSARSHAALTRRTARWAEHTVANGRGADPAWLGRIAAAAALRTDHEPCRAAVVAEDPADLAAGMVALSRGERAPGVVAARTAARRAPRVVLVLPGQGSQWDGMGRQLAAREPAFRDAMREADAALARRLARPLWDDATGLVAHGTATVQPALFAMQVALAATWRAWGLEPAAVIGHSMGEIAAAHIAGALSLDDAARIVCERSRLLAEISGSGGLALVELGVEDAHEVLLGRERELSVAAVNGPRATVLSGSARALDEVIAELSGRGVFARRVSVAFAAHSPQVEPLQPRLRTALDGIAPQASATPLYSTVTGGPVTGTELGPGYWVSNVRAPVLFAPALGRLIEDGYDAYVEVAPHPVLSRPVAELVSDAGAQALVVPSLRRGEHELRAMLTAVGELWSAGAPMDWGALHPGGAPHAEVPHHGWEHREFPVAGGQDGPARAGHRARGSGLLGERLPVGVEPSLRLWPLPLDLVTSPELADHVVGDVPIVPAAYWLAAAQEAGAAAWGGGGVVLEDVSFHRPCPLGDRPVADLQIAARPAADGGLRWTVTSSSVTGQPVVHAEGRVRPTTDGDAPRAPGEQHHLNGVDVARQYEQWERAGLRYGPRFRGLIHLQVGAQGARGRFCLPSGLDGSLAPAHPALLDACLQTIAAAAKGREPGAVLPLPVGAARVWGRPGGTPLREGQCLARVLHADDREVVADVTVFADDNTPVWSATGFRVRLTAPRRPVEEGRLYEVRWRSAEPAEATGGGGWLILGDPPGTEAARLTERLTRLGERCVTAGPEPEYAGLFARAEAGIGALRGVIDLRAAAGDPTVVAARALRLAQAVTGHTWRATAPRLWLVTAGTQTPAGSGEPGVLVGSVLWGLGRALANEAPEQGCSLVDLDRGVRNDEELDTLCAVLRRADPPSQAVLRGRRTLVPVLAAAADTPGAYTARPDRTYAITGGLGSLGLLVAKRLVERGARHLLLIGRHGPSPETSRRLAGLRAAGARVHVAEADLADGERVTGLLSPAHADRPGIGGVFHLAGVLEDALVADLNEAALERALAGKAVGAWHLHQATLGQPVESFVLFSSLAGLLGSPGQGAYAAANTFLDALAHHRTALGLPAQSIAWGPWAGSGLAVRAGGVERLAARGVPPLEPGRALWLLDQALESGTPQLAAVALCPDELRRAGSGPAFRQLFADLIPDQETARRGTGRDAVLSGSSPAERGRAMLRLVLDHVAAVLGRPAGALGASVSFQELGFDSLMAVELRGWLESALDLRLSAALVYDHPTVEALAEALLDRLAPDVPAVEEAADDELSELGDDEVAAPPTAELELSDRGVDPDLDREEER